MPEGQERVPWGYPCCATRFRVITDGTCELYLLRNTLPWGAARRIAATPQEKVPWGTTSAHRLYPLCTIYSVGAHIVRPRNALSNVFRANNVRPYGYTPANWFDAVRRGRRTLRCTVKSFGSIYRVERHKANCPKGKRSHTGVPCRATHLHIASPQVQSPFSILNYCFAYEKSTAFAVLSICR